jgi:PKD repeat protein
MTMTIRTIGYLGRACVLAALTAALPACGISEQTAPSVVGPAEFGVTLTATVSPDSISRDGSSEATITVLARGSDGAPLANQLVALALASSPAGTALSSTQVITGADGRATARVTAPPSTGVGDVITVLVAPIKDGVQLSAPRSLTIGVTPSNTGLPTASFTFSPATPGVNELVTFNAAASTDEGAACGTACTYAWDFGDGNTGSGMIVTKSYSSSGNKSVTLTVTDANGAAGLPTTQTVPVAPPTAPSVGTVAVSPTPVHVGVVTNFDAGGATVGTGASIVNYTWTWGDGTSDTVTTTGQAQHTFGAAGTYTVRTTVRDSLGRTATTTTTVTVT